MVLIDFTATSDTKVVYQQIQSIQENKLAELQKHKNQGTFYLHKLEKEPGQDNAEAIYSENQKEEIEVSVESENDVLEWKNLPDEIKQEMDSAFSQTEQMANAFNCLEQALENLKVKASINVEYKLPNLNEYKDALQNQTVLKKENPQDTYEVGEVLGEGGYACVAFVTRKSDGHKFAMKIVNYHAMDFSAKEMENMHNEIGILQVHKADHICFCLEAYDWKKSAWLILELMEDNITSFFDVEIDYSENVCKYIMRETLKGIRYLHQRHIVHRDIKSDNILFNQKGEIKLADFGCAVQLTKNSSKRDTLMGTDNWLAPEIIRTLLNSQQTYGVTVDVWSFGIFCVELAHREPPHFQESNQRSLYNKILEEDFKGLEKVNGQWSTQFNNFVAKCLNKDESSRSTCEDLLNDEFLKDAEKYKEDFVKYIDEYRPLKEKNK